MKTETTEERGFGEKRIKNWARHDKPKKKGRYQNGRQVKGK
jgi:hypothetical protein